MEEYITTFNGMTNLEVLKTLFPKMTVSYQSSNGVFTIVENFDSPYPQELYTEWCNTLYKAEGTN